MPLSEIIFITFSLLVLTMIVAGMSRHLFLPYTVLLVLLGIGIDMVSPYFQFTEQISQFHITPDTVFYLFLPALIFESTISLDARNLLKNILPILVMAIPGMLVSAFLVGFGLELSFEINFMVALLFGALISATDPVAVIALFKELGAPTRLTILVEGESLLNDATAIVLFHILLAILFQGEFSFSSTGDAIFDFFEVFLGGVLIGGFVGLMIAELIVKLIHDNETIAIVLSMAAAYISFIVAEHFFHVSGIMSVLTTAISFNLLGMNRLSRQTSHTIHSTWAFIVLICNSLLFLLIGMSVEPITLVNYWLPICSGFFAVMIARALSVYLLIPITTRLFSLPKISFGDQLIMWWGGLKGGLAIAIVLSIPDSLPEKQWLIELTLGVVLLSLLVNGSTVRSLIRWLKIDALTDDEETQLEQGMAKAWDSVNTVLQSFYHLNLLDKKTHQSIRHEIKEKFNQKPNPLSEQQWLDYIHLQAIQAENEELKYLYEIGLANYYVYLTFKDIIRRDKEQSFSDLEKSTQDVGFQNSFLRLENLLIGVLTKINWMHPILVRYQNMRFSNQLKHDIVGVLMAHAALKTIKNIQDYEIDEQKLEVIKNLYKHRLARRQSKLSNFSENHPEYYHQYQYIIFLHAALRDSLRRVISEYSTGKISNKVYSQIKRQLFEAERQIPILKASLSLNKRDEWLNQVPLFSGLPQPLLQRLARKCKYVIFLPGDTVFRENEKGCSIYIVVNGEVDVFRKNDQGVDTHLAELREGAFIGVHALVANGNLRSATVRAKTYVTLLKLTAGEVLTSAQLIPELESRLRKAALMM